MKMRAVAIFLCIFLSVSFMFGSESMNITYAQKTNKHEIRLSFSDGIPLSVANFLGTGIGDAITGTRRESAQSSGVLGIGYRYSSDRWRVGGDFGFGFMTSDLHSLNDDLPFMSQDDLNFMILPAGELVYLKKRLVDIYGSASLGVMFTRINYSGYLNNMNNSTDNSLYISNFYATFAFQINPVAIRVGNDRIGGFLELGVGYKGFLTAGVSIKF